jgi:hypothetical protein
MHKPRLAEMRSVGNASFHVTARLTLLERVFLLGMLNPSPWIPFEAERFESCFLVESWRTSYPELYGGDDLRSLNQIRH